MILSINGDEYGTEMTRGDDVNGKVCMHYVSERGDGGILIGGNH